MDSVRMDTCVRRSVLSAVGSNCGAKAQFFPPQTLCGHSTKGARWQRGIYILNATTGEGTQAKWALGLTQDGISRPQGYSPPLGGGKSPKYRGMKQLHIMACRQDGKHRVSKSHQTRAFGNSDSSVNAKTGIHGWAVGHHWLLWTRARLIATAGGERQEGNLRNASSCSLHTQALQTIQPIDNFSL